MWSFDSVKAFLSWKLKRRRTVPYSRFHPVDPFDMESEALPDQICIFFAVTERIGFKFSMIVPDLVRIHASAYAVTQSKCERDASTIMNIYLLFILL